MKNSGAKKVSKTGQKQLANVAGVDAVEIKKIYCSEYPPGSGYYYCTVRVRAHVPLPYTDSEMLSVEAKVFDSNGGLKAGPVSMSLEPQGSPANPDWYTTHELSFSLASTEKIFARVEARWRNPDGNSKDSVPQNPCVGRSRG